ncbi:MAG TPA: heparinase II/III family protein [Beijerinckiaceae bacterium]
MPRYSAVERWRLARHAAQQALSRARRASALPLRTFSDWRARGPQRLVIAPQDIRTSDPTIADDISAGYFAFGSRIVDTRGASPFALPPPTPEWEAALMGFGWLRHLRAAENALARENARALVDDWLAAHGRPREGTSWTPTVAARRLLSWVSQSPLLLEGADAGFYRRFLRGLGRHIAYLRGEMRGGLEGDARLFAAVALVQATLCSEGYASLRKRAGKWLTDELGAQILPDGGHIGRNPQTLVDLLLDLLPLRQAYLARNVAAPPELVGAIDRMMPMLRAFRHPDSALALFNGMGVTAPDTLATVLAYDDARAQPILNAPYSGYQRLEGEGAVLLFDAGGAPPPAFSRRAHAGALAFELSLDNQRLVVNCGAPATQNPALRVAARSTAAHSTLCLDGESSARLPDEEDGFAAGRIVIGPSAPRAVRQDLAAGAVAEATHDGYASRFGLLHSRQVALAADGARAEGVDRLTRAPGAKAAQSAQEAVIRFHLHPAVRAEPLEADQGVALTLPGGEVWVFHASGAPVAIEESAYFAAPDGTRATRQLVLRAPAEDGLQMNWTFMRG